MSGIRSILRTIMISALLLCASVLMNGCATSLVWSGHGRPAASIVTRQEEVSSIVHSESMDRICFRFKGERNDEEYVLTAGIDPATARFLVASLASPREQDLKSTSVRVKSVGVSLRGAKWHSNVKADLSLSFNVPYPSSSDTVSLSEIEFPPANTFPAAGRPTPRNPIVQMLARNTMGGPVAVREVAWVDARGAVLPEAAEVEKLSCDEAVEQNISLLLTGTGPAKPGYVRVPAAIVCKYNCGTLLPCSLKATTPWTGVFTASLTGAGFGPASKAGAAGSEACRSPDWTEIRFAPGKTFIAYDEAVEQPGSNLKLAARIVATPVAVAFDIVTSPVQIVVGVVMLVSMKDLILFGVHGDGVHER